MAKCKICPNCGASLDFGEQCDCKEKEDASAGTETSSNRDDAFVNNNVIIPNPSEKINETEQFNGRENISTGSNACNQWYCEIRNGSYCCNACADKEICNSPCLNDPDKCGYYRNEREERKE